SGKSFEGTYCHRFVNLSSPALALARVITNPAKNRREWICLLDKCNGLFEFSLTNEGDITPRILVGWTRILAWSVEEGTTDSRATVLVYDMFYVFMSEKTKGGKHRVWGSLAEAT